MVFVFVVHRGSERAQQKEHIGYKYTIYNFVVLEVG